jgi:hypothetical protein
VRPAAFFWAVVPPCEELERDVDLPPRLDAPVELAIRAARDFDIPLSLSASYCFSFLTLALLPGILDPPYLEICSTVHADLPFVGLLRDVGLGDHADERVALDDRQSAYLVVRHQLERLAQVAVGLDRDEVLRRDLADGCPLRVLPLCDHPKRDVPIGHGADKRSVLDDRDHPRMSLFHQLRRLGRRLARLDGLGARRHHVTNALCHRPPFRVWAFPPLRGGNARPRRLFSGAGRRSGRASGRTERARPGPGRQAGS